MFIELRISNVAVLKDLRVSLEPGLNVLSGETGAGKSIVVDALEVLLGGRASSGMVRAGEARALVEGVVDVGDLEAVGELLAELGLESDDGHLVLRREVRAEGRSRGWVNGSPATAGMLRRIGSLLVDIHGQHEHQRLLSAGFQRQVLDAFGGCAELAGDVADGFRRVAELASRLASLEERCGELESRADFIRFQLGEITGAKLHAGEDDELRIEAEPACTRRHARPRESRAARASPRGRGRRRGPPCGFCGPSAAPGRDGSGARGSFIHARRRIPPGVGCGRRTGGLRRGHRP